MSLLELKNVSKRYRHGSEVYEVLRNVSLEVEPGELVAVWGLRGSGRSTLLRLAAGIETPDEGTVRFAGRDLTAGGACALAKGIGYCHRPPHGTMALEEIVAGSLARGDPPSMARMLAEATLERCEVRPCGARRSHELNSGEVVRVSIAQGLASKPSLMLIDEPTKGVDLLDRDGILRLLRSLAHEGIAILTSVCESTGLFGADRALSLSDGEMHGHITPELAPVVRLPQRVSA